MNQRIDRFDGPYDYLSNFYPACVRVDGLEYLSSEGAYQAAKCADPEERLLFTQEPPNVAKHMGRKVSLRPDWEAVKVAEMEKIVTAKFTQNPHLASFLLETGDAVLLEGNTWHDIFWGIDLKTGEGENHLGKILMDLRETFRLRGLPPMEGQLPWKEAVSADGIRVQYRDLTQADCEAIVSATNENMYGHDGLDQAVHRTAGPELKAACCNLGTCRETEAKLTPGFRLKAKYVIHTVGPRYGTEGAELRLAQTYRNVLDLAAEKGIRSIAMPAISVGKFSYPKAGAAQTAVKTVRQWKKEMPDFPVEVTFCCLDRILFEAFLENL